MAVQSEIETLDPNDSGRGELEDSYVETKVAVKDQLGEELNSTRPPHPPFSLAQSSSIALWSSKLPVLPCRLTEHLQNTKISSSCSHKLSLVKQPCPI